MCLRRQIHTRAVGWGCVLLGDEVAESPTGFFGWGVPFTPGVAGGYSREALRAFLWWGVPFSPGDGAGLLAGCVLAPQVCASLTPGCVFAPRGCASLTSGCVLAPLQGACGRDDRKPGVALR